MPDLCIYDGKSLISTVTENFIEPNTIIGAIKLNIPKDAMDELERMREVRKHDVLVKEVVNAIEKSRMGEDF